MSERPMSSELATGRAAARGRQQQRMAALKAGEAKIIATIARLTNELESTRLHIGLLQTPENRMVPQAKDKTYNELSKLERGAVRVLGFRRGSWDGRVPKENGHQLFEELSNNAQHAALLLGYSQSDWDAEVREARELERLQEVFEAGPHGGCSGGRLTSEGSARAPDGAILLPRSRLQRGTRSVAPTGETPGGHANLEQEQLDEFDDLRYCPPRVTGVALEEVGPGQQVAIGVPTAVPNTRGKDKDWHELNEEERAAATALGFDRSSWDEGDSPPSCMKLWHHLSEEEVANALTLGYDEEEWNEEIESLVDDREGTAGNNNGREGAAASTDSPGGDGRDGATPPGISTVIVPPTTMPPSSSSRPDTPHVSPAGLAMPPMPPMPPATSRPMPPGPAVGDDPDPVNTEMAA